MSPFGSNVAMFGCLLEEFCWLILRAAFREEKKAKLCSHWVGPAECAGPLGGWGVTISAEFRKDISVQVWHASTPDLKARGRRIETPWGGITAAPPILVTAGSKTALVVVSGHPRRDKSRLWNRVGDLSRLLRVLCRFAVGDCILQSSLIKQASIINHHSSSIKHESSILNHQSPITNHEASSINHQSSIINHQSSISNHQSSISNQQSSTMNHLSSIIKHQASIINHQSSAINHQTSTINLQSSIINQQASISSHQAAIINHQSSSINHQSSFIKHQSSIIKHQSPGIKHQSSIIKHQASSINHQASISNQ